MSTTERKTLTLDADGLLDLQIIAQRQNGKGAALQRMLERAEMTQSMLAIGMGLSRSAISTWCAEDRWPSDDDMRRALVLLGIDKKPLLDTWGVLLSTDIQPRSDLTKLAVDIKILLGLEDDPLNRKLIIGRTLEEEVFLRQGFRAREDPKSADLFWKRLDKYEEENRLRAGNSAKNVTPTPSANWLSNPHVQSVTVAPDLTLSGYLDDDPVSH